MVRISIWFSVFLLIGIPAFADFTENEEFDDNNIELLAWGDYDGDGDLDVGAGNFGQSYLYINDGSGNFTQYNEFGTDNTHSLAWGDYDNDGDLDVAVGNTNYQQNFLYINDGGSFIEQEQFGTNTTLTLAWADSDNDGDLDLAVGNQGINYLYVNNGDGTFTGNSEFGAGITRSLSWGDCDGDGDRDMIVANLGQQNYLYRNNGDNEFTEESQFGIGDTTAVSWGDYDNDGDLDVAVGNFNSQNNKLYVNDGDGNFTPQDQFGSMDTHSLTWGDYDNDGDIDLAVGNLYQQNYLYINNGGGGFTGQEQFGAGRTTTTSWGDCDGDGDIDLAVGNYGEQSYLYENNEDDNDYLHFHLVGHFYDQGSGYSNRDGVGAKVFVFEEGYIRDFNHLLGFREVEANAGYCGQNSVDVEFGLPSWGSVDILVIWPGSGGYHIEQELLSVNIPQITEIDESGELIPNAIKLLSFEAVPGGENSIALNWSVEATEGETIEGFNLYRKKMGFEENDAIVRTKAPSSLPNVDENWTKINSSLITGENPYTYLDENVESGLTYKYRLEAVVEDIPENLGTTICKGGVPTSLEIISIHPNPTENRVSITFKVPDSDDIEIQIYDITGRIVKDLSLGEVQSGEYTEVFETNDLPSGVYTVKMVSGVDQSTGSIVIVP